MKQDLDDYLGTPQASFQTNLHQIIYFIAGPFADIFQQVVHNVDNTVEGSLRFSSTVNTVHASYFFQRIFTRLGF